MLTRAKFLCQLCGISAHEKSIEVDHIHPKSLGEIDDLSNFQALCYSCNATKRNIDDTDFRNFTELNEHREAGCLFCDIQIDHHQRIIAENNLAYALRDGFPVTAGHTPLKPKRHVSDYFGLTQAEINAINQLIAVEKRQLESTDPKIVCFNVGMNCGQAAGQTVLHCHVHLIPRRQGDVESPRGGVRHVIPSKGRSLYFERQ